MPKDAFMDSAEEPQLAKNQHQERPSKHPRQKSKSFVRHLRVIFFGLFSRKQMVFPKTGGCSAESGWNCICVSRVLVLLILHGIASSGEAWLGRFFIHQAVGVDLPASLLASFCQRRWPILAMHVIQQDAFLPVSTVPDVIHRSRILYAQRPRHAPTVPNPITTSSALIERGQPMV